MAMLFFFSNVLCQCPLCTEFCSYFFPSFFGKPTGYEWTGLAFSESWLLQSSSLVLQRLATTFSKDGGCAFRAKQGDLHAARESFCTSRPSKLCGPTATVVLSRCTVALHSVALRFPVFGGVSQETRTTPPEKGHVVPTFSAFKGGVALQVASWKVSQ